MQAADIPSREGMQVMTALIETELLRWIGEEALQGSKEGALNVVPLRMLVMRLALLNNIPSDGLSKSTELALNEFEQVELIRLLRQLSKKNLINFTAHEGAKLNDEQSKDLGRSVFAGGIMGSITLTQLGQTEVKRLLGSQKQASSS